MAEDKSHKNLRQAIAVQLAALGVFGGIVYFDISPDGTVDTSIFLLLALLAIAIGLSPEAWADLIARIFGRGGDK